MMSIFLRNFKIESCIDLTKKGIKRDVKKFKKKKKKGVQREIMIYKSYLLTFKISYISSFIF